MNVDKVLADLKNERTRIDGTIRALESLGSGKTTRFSRAKGKEVVRKRKPMSAATKRKLKLAAKKRWAERKAAK